MSVLARPVILGRMSLMGHELPRRPGAGGPVCAIYAEPAIRGAVGVTLPCIVHVALSPLCPELAV